MIAVDFGPPRIPICLANFVELVADDLRETLGSRQYVAEVADLLQQLFVLANDLVLLETGEAVQAHVENRLRLGLGQMVVAAVQSRICGKSIRTSRNRTRA